MCVGEGTGGKVRLSQHLESTLSGSKKVLRPEVLLGKPIPNLPVMNGRKVQNSL